MNRLAGETSAYLRQHMENPVDWYPWGAEALDRARQEDRPLLVSIGYSACHWCHVMEHESFEDPETAELMNRLFVNVKVDREERPDVDQLYMDTVVGLTGHGGWPLTVFCTPEGQPFHGGTYYPPEPRHGMPSFRQVLTRVAEAWNEKRDEVVRSAGEILAALERRPEGVTDSAPDLATAERAALRLLQRADPEHGGFGGAPKFPSPPNLELLLAAGDWLPPRKRDEVLDHVLLTCREMSRGGIYDQLGGGFHRYSVDERWAVPHFEKMLYDQGQLLRIYAETWRRTGNEELLWPVRETVEFLRREMKGEEGAFYASQDADSEGEEGRFYVWTPAQIQQVLGPGAAPGFCQAYGVREAGNFEGGATVLADRARGPRSEWAEQRESLRRARAERPAPGTDRKHVASWNALAISGLARAGSLLGDPAMLDDAVAAADFLLGAMRDAEGRLLRVWNQGQTRVFGFLDDMAASLEACLDLHRAGAGERFLAAALELAEDLVARFFDHQVGDFFLTPSDAEPLALRPRSDHDGAMPHSTGMAVLGLLRLSEISGRQELRQVAETALFHHATLLERAPEAFPTLARAAALWQRRLSVAVVIGEPEAEVTRALAARARRVLAAEDAVLVASPGSTPDGVDATWLEGRGSADARPCAYVCRGVTCSLPVTDPDELEPCPTPETRASTDAATKTG